MASIDKHTRYYKITMYHAALSIARNRTIPLYTRRRAIQVARFWQSLLMRQKLEHAARRAA